VTPLKFDPNTNTNKQQLFLIIITIKPLFFKNIKHILLLPNLGHSTHFTYLQTKVRLSKAS
jgi:hypothetical protein